MQPIQYEEIQCKTVLNKVNAPGLFFRWTINPYRGCQHACVYCFARHTHQFLGYDSGHDFNQKIVVKVNAPEVLREELRRPTWRSELVVLGTATDPWQQAEVRYRVTRRIVEALAERANPLSILTKSSIITQDTDVLQEAARRAPVQVNFTVGFLDEDLWRRIEPGTPSPRKRLEALQRLAKAGIPTGIMLAPILPGLTDTRESLEEVIRAAVAHGAQRVHPVVLPLRPGSKEWFMPFLRQAYPYLSPQYQRMYKGSYAPESYTKRVYETVEELRQKLTPERSVGVPEPPKRQSMGQLALAF